MFTLLLLLLLLTISLGINSNVEETNLERANYLTELYINGDTNIPKMEVLDSIYQLNDAETRESLLLKVEEADDIREVREAIKEFKEKGSIKKADVIEAISDVGNPKDRTLLQNEFEAVYNNALFIYVFTIIAIIAVFTVIFRTVKN